MKTILSEIKNFKRLTRIVESDDKDVKVALIGDGLTTLLDSNDFINISHNIYNYEEDILNYDKWLNSFKDNDNKLFSDINYKNIYSNGSNEYIKIIKNYLYILIKTINNQKSTIINDFINNIEFINFKQLINNSMKIISKSYYEDINENDVILEKSISDIKYII